MDAAANTSTRFWLLLLSIDDEDEKNGNINDGRRGWIDLKAIQNLTK